MIAQVCTFPDNDRIAHLRQVNLIVLKIYLNNTFNVLWDIKRVEGLQRRKADPDSPFPKIKSSDLHSRREPQYPVKTWLGKRRNPTNKHVFTFAP